MEALKSQRKLIEEHRNLWVFITKEIARRKKPIRNFIFIRDYLESKGCEIEGPADGTCFCCQGEDALDTGMCEHCLLVWGGNPHCTCIDEGGEYGKFLDAIGTEHNTWKKQVKLAYKIATLPVRDVLEYNTKRRQQNEKIKC